MKNVIIGTAGHVDHGKTTLLKALTGVDLDTLQEEQKRGITINPGYSTMENDRGLDIGIIDVPGHEKFVHNMLTGIGGVDLVLLLISAEEGIMPQTREHFEIVKALGIDTGILVLTKVDLVDREWIPILEEEAREMVQGSFLEDAPLAPVSAYTGENIETLRNLMLDMAEAAEETPRTPELTRLPVDRIFSVAGHGTVVTGTLVEGAIRKGDTLRLYPKEDLAAVRGVQVHGKEVEEAFGGQRVALNISVKKDRLEVGDVLAPPHSLPLTKQIDVAIHMFASTERTMKNSSRVHVNYGSGEALARVILFGEDELLPAMSAYGQLRFEAPIPIRKDDPFVLRFFSPVESIAGGRVLEVHPKRHKRKDERVVERLSQKDTGDDATIFALALEENRYRYADERELGAALGFSEEKRHALRKELTEAGTAVELPGGLLVHAHTAEGVLENARAILARYHEEFPLETGMPKQAFRHQLQEAEHFDDEKIPEAFLAHFYQKHLLEDHGKRIEDSHFTATLTPEQEKQWQRAEAIAKEKGFEGADDSDFVPVGKKREHVLRFMEESGTLIALETRTLHRDVWDEAVSIALAMIDETGKMKLADFRNAIDTSRKYAVEILDEMDRRGFTKFHDGVRVRA